MFHNYQLLDSIFGSVGFVFFLLEKVLLSQHSCQSLDDKLQVCIIMAR